MQHSSKAYSRSRQVTLMPMLMQKWSGSFACFRSCVGSAAGACAQVAVRPNTNSIVSQVRARWLGAAKCMCKQAKTRAHLPAAGADAVGVE